MLLVALGVFLMAIGATCVHESKRRLLLRTSPSGVEQFRGTGHFFRSKAVDGLLKIGAAGGIGAGGLYVLVGVLEVLGR